MVIQEDTFMLKKEEMKMPEPITASPDHLKKTPLI